MTAPHPAVLVTLAGEVDRDSATWTPEPVVHLAGGVEAVLEYAEPLPRQSARTWEDLEAQS